MKKTTVSQRFLIVIAAFALLLGLVLVISLGWSAGIGMLIYIMVVLVAFAVALYGIMKIICWIFEGRL